jgi:hypothetical protein
MMESHALHHDEIGVHVQAAMVEDHTSSDYIRLGLVVWLSEKLVRHVWD